MRPTTSTVYVDIGRHNSLSPSTFSALGALRIVDALENALMACFWRAAYLDMA
jgi:hypothetical protein